MFTCVSLRFFSHMHPARKIQCHTFPLILFSFGIRRDSFASERTQHPIECMRWDGESWNGHKTKRECDEIQQKDELDSTVCLRVKCNHWKFGNFPISEMYSFSVWENVACLQTYCVRVIFLHKFKNKRMCSWTDHCLSAFTHFPVKWERMSRSYIGCNKIVCGHTSWKRDSRQQSPTLTTITFFFGVLFCFILVRSMRIQCIVAVVVIGRHSTYGNNFVLFCFWSGGEGKDNTQI